MPLDASFAGRTYPPTAPYEVCREKIREFADAIGDPDPAYRDPEAARTLGHPDVVAPPTFAVIVAFRGLDTIIGDPDLGLDYSRVVHGDQRFSYRRPLRAGDRVTATAVVETVRSLGGNDILGVRCDLATEDGEAVGSAWSTLVARGEGS
ncbi:MAG TPA: MaoC family dehydratase N-terminal domain-containing protein [Jiangellales bacterium]|nr:MaoC family dehydratase N-terminal domain-containing protein [Jiangellales bacterium]